MDHLTYKVETQTPTLQKKKKYKGNNLSPLLNATKILDIRVWESRPPIPQRKQWNKRMNIRGPLFLKKPYVLCCFFSVFSCWSDLLLVYVGGWYEIRSSLFMSLFVKTVFTMGTNIIVVFSLSDLSINKVWVIILDEIGASYKLTKKKFPLKKAT